MKSNSDIKKDRWTENQLLALPSKESDKFDRKAGAFLKDNGFEEKLAKALSALANSGGGHLIIGAEDDTSIDGVNKIHKGRTTTKDWLEQKIPYLLLPLLQDFRVHEVKKAKKSLIPLNKEVIIVDVGDSDLAPHQSYKDYLYYYRAGGRSEPAPHQYLDLLRKRGNYPGPKIAEAWVYNIINPLLHVLEWELKYLRGGRWGYDKHNPKSLKELHIINKANNSANYEQFFNAYPNILDYINNHDTIVKILIENLEAYYKFIKENPLLYKTYKSTTYLESLKKLNDKKNEDYNYKIRECKSAKDFRNVLFSNSTETEIIEFFAQFIINKTWKLSHTNLFFTYWNVFSHNFRVISLNNCAEKIAVGDSKNKLNKALSILFTKLKKIRERLCYEYQIPFEESQQNIVYIPNNHGYRYL